MKTSDVTIRNPYILPEHSCKQVVKLGAFSSLLLLFSLAASQQHIAQISSDLAVATLAKLCEKHNFSFAE